ncbi:3-oxo-tetronate kinase [Paracoccus pacificus]|uniref:3-oxo-tetronate kinase n=1 Tax=Paracoccus pacificus TaxID=1463598 RepID=A0ABW4R5S3_9RHOB
MLLGVIADDFTGAGDIANTLAKGSPGGDGGLKVMQYMGVPSGSADPEIEAGVISLKTRTIPAAEAVTTSLAALSWLLAQGCRQIIFKYCSTFDSTPEGNIGPVAEALADVLNVRGVIACPAFPTMGRTVHQGHLFVGDRLLSESGMRNHPLTPMTDPDLRRWLGRQSRDPVGLVATGTVRKGPDAVRAALNAAAERGETLVIADAATDDDLITLGQAAADARLITGGSGIAIGLAANFIARGLASGSAPGTGAVSGPGVVLAGSCSGATLGQVERHAADHPSMAVSPEDVMSGSVGVDDIMAFFRANAGNAPLVYSSGSPEEVTAAQNRFGREKLSNRLESLFADAARAAADAGFSRIVVAGGETSGAVALRLGAGPLRIGAEIDTGVPILYGTERPVALALKSGNFGGPDFFVKALKALAGGAESAG